MWHGATRDLKSTSSDNTLGFENSQNKVSVLWNALYKGGGRYKPTHDRTNIHLHKQTMTDEDLEFHTNFWKKEFCPWHGQKEILKALYAWKKLIMSRTYFPLRRKNPYPPPLKLNGRSPRRKFKTSTAIWYVHLYIIYIRVE